MGWQRVAAVSAPELVRGERELRIRASSGDARLQPRSDEEVVDHFSRSQVELKRYPQIGGRVGDEVAADDADNQPRLAVHLDSGADDFWVPAKAPLPQTVTQHGNVTAIWTVFRGGERAPGNDGSAEQREVSAGNMDAEHLLRMISAREVHPAPPKS